MFAILTLAAALAYAQASSIPTGYGPNQGSGPNQGYGPNPGYGPNQGYDPTQGYGPNPGYGYAHQQTNFYPDINEARSRIHSLAENDVILNNRLDGVEVKVKLLHVFRQIFENEILPGIHADMEEQDERIKAITERLKNMMVLFDEVEALQTQVNNLVADLQEVRATRVDAEGDLSRLENADIDQERDIAEIQAQVDYQDKRLDEAAEKVSENEAFVERVYEETIRTVEIINYERIEGTFDVVLDSNNPTQYVQYSRPFPFPPAVSWYITGLSIIEGDKKYEESIYLHVDVSTDEFGVNVTLIDQSQTWFVERVEVRLGSGIINGQIRDIH